MEELPLLVELQKDPWQFLPLVAAAGVAIGLRFWARRTYFDSKRTKKSTAPKKR
jgi:hypothetical protein